MDKHYAIHIALLGVGRRDKKPHVQTCGKEKGSGNREPWNDLSREGIKIDRRCVFVEVHSLVLGLHSKDILSAAEVAQGAKVRDSTVIAPSK